MIIEQQVTHCDMSQREYPKPVPGGGYLAQGATGRWCVVLWCGPEYIKSRNLKLLTREEAIQEIKEHHDGWPDF